MTQRAALQALDAEILQVLFGEGLADDALYYPAVGAPVACRAVVDRGVTLVGPQGQVITDQTTITAYLAELHSRPDIGTRFQIGDEWFKVDSISNADESRVICTVKVGV